MVALPRIVFMGTPDLAAVVLSRLVAGGVGEVVGVVVQPDRPVGRHLELTPPPVKVEALKHGLPVLQPLKAREPEFLEKLRGWAPDVIVVAAYGQILPQALLDIPRYGCLNVHTSLLPRWRGAAPIQWAIAEGDTESGVCLMRMEAGLDTGPVVATLRTPISDQDTGRTLHDRLAVLGGQVVVDNLAAYLAGGLKPVPQPAEGVTYARKITREDGRLDWAMPARVLWRRLRAFDPWPGAFCFLPAGVAGGARKLLKVHSVAVVDEVSGMPGTVVPGGRDELMVACGQGALRLLEVQVEGGRRIPASAFRAGHSVDRFE
jgi:methionyl-tRNA formyltransferase